MPNFFEFLSLFLMFSHVDVQSTSQACVSPSSIFAEWGTGENHCSLPSPFVRTIELDERSMIETVDSSFVFLLEKTIAEQKEVPYLWEGHLRYVGRLLSFFQLINSEKTNLFNPLTEKPMNILDLKLLADILFNYDSNLIWSFQDDLFILFPCSPTELKCLDNDEECLSPCFDQKKNCYSLSYLSNEKHNKDIIQTKLRTIKENLDTLPPSSQVLFFCCETFCCKVIHQVTSLIIMKNLDNSFRVFYLDPSDLSPPAFLNDLVYSIFKVNLFIPVLNQQAKSFSSFSGLLTLINAKAWVHETSLLSNVDLEKNFRLENYLEPDPVFNSSLENFILKVTFRLFWEKLLFHLNCFTALFSRERERILTSVGTISPIELEQVKRIFKERQIMFQNLFTQIVFEKNVFAETTELYTDWNNSRENLSSFFKQDFSLLTFHLRHELDSLSRQDYPAIISSFWSYEKQITK